MSSRNSVERIQRLSLLLCALAVLGSLVFRSLSVTLGVAVGGALATINFYALRRIMQGLLQASGSHRQLVLGVLLVGKFGLLAAALYLSIKLLPLQPLALLVGISVVVLSVFVEGFRVVLCHRSSAACE